MKNLKHVDLGLSSRRAFLQKAGLAGVSVGLAGTTIGAAAEPLGTAFSGKEKPCRIVEGPLKELLPELAEIVRDPEVAKFLSDLTPHMEELASLPLPEAPHFEKVKITHEERQSILLAIDESLDSLLRDLPPDQQLTSDQVRQIRKEAQMRVFHFLHASEREMEELRSTLLPLNQASVPVATTIGDSFVLLDLAGPNLFLLSPLALVGEDDKLIAKLGIIAGLVAAIIAAILGVLGIKVPSVKTDKIVPFVSKAIQNPAGRTAFLTMIEIIKREGETIGNKIKAILDFLKVLWNLGALKDILKEMLSGFSIFDLVLTIAGIAAVFLTGGTAVVVKLTGIGLGLISSLIGAGAAYQKLQES